MLLLASEAAGRSRTVMDVARELSLNTSYYRDAASLEGLMQGSLRRIVLLNRRDITADTVDVLKQAARSTPFGLIVSSSREAMRLRNQDEFLDELEQLGEVTWLGQRYTSGELAAAARECRRGLLRLSREELELALAEGQFTLRYQPKVERTDTAEWRTREAEALLRWQHPAHGWLGPLEFLPELEEFGLMSAVSEFVLREAAAQLNRWRGQDLVLNSCINLASSLLSDPALPDTYQRIVAGHGLECGNFTFEVIEQDIADSEAPHLKTLNELRRRGFRVSLDDFGIAQSSLGTLEQLPVDEIKIHAAALARARRSELAQKVLAAVTGLAHNLGISVCAEGVEDEETYEFLKTIECDKMQGYLISEAVMPEIIQSVYRADGTEREAAAG